MARMMAFVIAGLTLALLLNIFNLTTQSQGGVLSEAGITDVINGDYSSDSNFFGDLFNANIGLLIVGLGGGIALTFFSRSPTENYLILPFITTTLVLFVGALWDPIIVANNMPNWIRIPIVLIMAPFTLGYIITMIEFFRGNV